MTYPHREHNGMHRKLTITLEAQVYGRLREVVGPGRISRFIED